jgi:hypothetical protein
MKYMEKLPIFIYDFSIVEDTFNARSNEITLTVSPGVKVVPNRTVLLVYKTVFDNWSQIKRMEENKERANTVRIRGDFLNIEDFGFSFSYEIGLYDDYGDRIANAQWYNDSRPWLFCRYTSRFQVLAQHKYYSDTDFKKIRFTVPLDKITESMTPKIERISWSQTDYSVFTVEGWQEWLASQGGTRN